jgi:hypothetical protein
MLNMGLIGVIIVVALLNIILFFKVWGMTSNTHKIRLLLEAQRPDLEYKEETDSNYAHYRDRVQEKKD